MLWRSRASCRQVARNRIPTMDRSWQGSAVGEETDPIPESTGACGEVAAAGPGGGQDGPEAGGRAVQGAGAGSCTAESEPCTESWEETLDSGEAVEDVSQPVGRELRRLPRQGCRSHGARPTGRKEARSHKASALGTAANSWCLPGPRLCRARPVCRAHGSDGCKAGPCLLQPRQQ